MGYEILILSQPDSKGREREERLVRGPVGQRRGEILIPGRSRMTRECHVRFL